MGKNSLTRREFIATGIGLALAGCTTFTKRENEIFRIPASPSGSGSVLSDDIEEFLAAKNFEAIVIGSGYGASVMAARLSPHFKSLCILERGPEWKLGEFPTELSQLAGSLRTGKNPQGLVDISTSLAGDADIVCASGLGGTSLLNAAIAIEPEPNVFQTPQWPDEIKRAALDSGPRGLGNMYARARQVLKSTPVKFNGDTEKSNVHKRSALNFGRSWNQLDLNIRDPDYTWGKNEVGMYQGPCVRCGNCCTGCNFGAKNTLGMNYLPMAKHNGAKIFTSIEVDHIEKIPEGGGYLIHYVLHGSHEGQKGTIRAKYVFLGAGSKGSTEILLRSQRDHFLLSNALGTRLSANGDVMGVAYNTNYRTSILAQGRPTVGGPIPGTIIASYIDYRNPSPEGDVDSQFLLLDGVMPSSLSELVAQHMANLNWAGDLPFHIPGMDFIKKPRFSDTQMSRITTDIKNPGDPEGALNHSMLYFACGHDSSGGKFEYNRWTNSFDYKWPDVLEDKNYKRINKIMAEYAEKLGGVFIPNPRATVFGGKHIQATHPLGGCPMGQNKKSGAVDHLGRVFDAQSAKEFHDGLYVVDAAIIPRSLAATPLMTITALAERIAESIL